MNNYKREFLLNHRQGLLKFYNLWSFWDLLTEIERDKILTYFENTPQFLNDYKSLFIGDLQGNSKNGPISYLGNFCVSLELKTYDKIYRKFLEYTPRNYSFNSEWGLKWESEKIRFRNILKSNYFEDNTKDVNDLLLKESLLFIEDIYLV